MGHPLPTLPSSPSVIMNVNKQQPVTNLRKYLDKMFQVASCWSHCSRCLILHSDGCTSQIKRDWRQRRVTSLVSERGPAMLWCVSRATVLWHWLVTALSSSLLEKRLSHRGYSTLALAERNCPVGELLLLTMLGWQLWGYEQPRSLLPLASELIERLYVRIYRWGRDVSCIALRSTLLTIS